MSGVYEACSEVSKCYLTEWSFHTNEKCSNLCKEDVGIKLCKSQCGQYLALQL